MIAVGSFGSISGFIGLQFSFAVLGVFEKYRRNANLMFILVFVLVCALFYWMGMINLAILISGFLTGSLVGLIVVHTNFIIPLSFFGQSRSCLLGS